MERKTLTPELQEAVGQLPRQRLQQLMELRLRRGGEVRAVYPWGEELLTYRGGSIPVTEQLLRDLLNRATGFSPYALRGEERGLFLPLDQGDRMGLCGEALIQEGRLCGLRHVNSMVIRFARQCQGVAAEAADRLLKEEAVPSVLIVSPPGQGKTTFLRDLIRLVSQRGIRVSVADERRELSAAREGVPQLDLGPATDVLTGCPKAQAMGLLLRVMNPQVLAVDELAGPEELSAVGEASASGVAVFATAHGENLASLRRRRGFRELLEEGTFSWCITLRQRKLVQMERLGGYAENSGSVFCGGGFADERMGIPAGNAAAASPAAAASAGPGADAGGNGAAHAAGGGAL